MAELYGVLTTIALLDSTSMITVSTVPLIAIMASQRPVPATLAFIAGTYVAYFACGVLVFMGLDSFFDAVGGHVERWWTHPDAADLILQIVIGVVMLVVALVMMRTGKKPPQKQPKSMSPASVFAFAAFLVVVGIPGAIPLFAAVDQMLRADLSTAAAVWALLYYNFVFVLPLFVIIIIRVALADRADRVFERINSFLSVWGARVVITVLFLLGLALVVDGVGWMLGRSFMSFIPIG